MLLLAALTVLMVEGFILVDKQLVKPLVGGMQNWIYDLSFRARSQNQAFREVSPDNIVIVDIDEETITNLGRFQLWPRSFDAEVIRNINAGQPKGMAVDLLYPEPDTFSSFYRHLLLAHGFEDADSILRALTTDAILAEAIADAGNVYLGLFNDNRRVCDSVILAEAAQTASAVLHNSEIASLPSMTCPVVPINMFARSARGVGAIDLPGAGDGVVRTYPVAYECVAGNDRYLMGSIAALMTLDAAEMSLVDATISDRRIQFGSSSVPLTSNGSFMLNWLGTSESFRRIPYYKVYEGLIPSEFFHDKWIFIGASATGLFDLKSTPVSDVRIPGVEIHATALLNMLNDAFIKNVGSPVRIIGGGLFCLILVAVFLYLKPLMAFVVAIALIFIEFAVFILWILPELHIALPIMTVILLTALSAILTSVYSHYFEERQKKKALKAFTTYIAPGVVDRILQSSEALELGGEKKNLTVMFTDLRGFTSFSESLPPEEVVHTLNVYHDAMSEIILRNEGTIDKFIGDAIMAIFGAPLFYVDHAERACRVALALSEKIRWLNASREKQGLHPFSMGISINTGDMIVGNIGSTQRFDYTVVGDAVNLTARMDSLTKLFHAEILVSESTYLACKESDLVFRPMGKVRVRGKKRHVEIYQLIDPLLSEAHGDSINAWNTAYDCLQRGDFGRGVKLLEQYILLNDQDQYAKAVLRKATDQGTRASEIMTVEMNSK